MVYRRLSSCTCAFLLTSSFLIVANVNAERYQPESVEIDQIVLPHEHNSDDATVSSLISSKQQSHLITYAHNESDFHCNEDEVIPIHQLYGEPRSPFIKAGEFESREQVTIRGIVTARGDKLFKGFYLQDLSGEYSDSASNGAFVHLGEEASAQVQPGTLVCVKGPVKDYFGLTEINLQNEKKIHIGEKVDIPAPAQLRVREGETLAQALKRYMGMKVVIDATSDLKVTRPFSFDFNGRRNNMLVSYQAPLVKPTQLYPALSEDAIALQAANQTNQLYIESDGRAPNGVVPYFSGFNPHTGYIRVGDQLTQLQGVVHYSFGAYRLVATNQIQASDFIRDEERPAAPKITNQGDLRVASFNVLNFFNDVVKGARNPSGQNRGAKTAAEFSLQRTKIVNALTAMDADIIGLMEIENNGFGAQSAIRNLVTALNAELAIEDSYRYVEIADEDKFSGQYFGRDAITVGLLYRPSKVTLAGAAQVINLPEQHVKAGVVTRHNENKNETNPAKNVAQRSSLAQTFMIHDQLLTIVVNHFKSKGSACFEDWVNFEESSDPADFQGKCNAFRVSTAKVLGESLNTVAGDVLVIGDLNAYAQEDPIRVLTDFDAAHSNRSIKTASWTTLNGQVFEQQASDIDKSYGLINLSTYTHGSLAYSYSYNGELGSLDHALANRELANRLLDIEYWHINAVESRLFEYAKKFTGNLEKSTNVFSASDHDPVIMAFSYPATMPTTNSVAKRKRIDD